MFRWLIVFWATYTSMPLQVQQLITSLVKDASNQQPICGASVFVNNGQVLLHVWNSLLVLPGTDA
ncbi:MAG: hypothetical protein ACK4HE_01860 [Chitinophagaceae bacterium]